MQVIDMIQVRWDSVLVYGCYQGARGASREKLKILREKAYSGKVKKEASKRLYKAIDLMIQLSRVRMKARPGGKVMPFRLGFWTLTVPGQIRKATEVHKYFKRFLDWMRYRNCLYIWKAEYQKRGQVHYHLIVNQFVPWSEIRIGWNKILKKGGYLDSYAKQYGHFNPNSVDVRAVKSNKALSIYLRKYLVKDHDRVPEGGLKKWWGASASLLGSRFSTELWREDWERIQRCKEIFKDENKRYLIARGKRKDLISKYTSKQYNRWRRERRQAGWTKSKQGNKNMNNSLYATQF